jgi:hypothetical protein
VYKCSNIILLFYSQWLIQQNLFEMSIQYGWLENRTFVMETVSTTNVGFFQLLLLFSYEIFCSKRYTSQHYQFHYHTKNHFFFWCIHVKTLRSPKTNSTLHGNIYNESQSISIKNRILGQRKFPGIRQH